MKHINNSESTYGRTQFYFIEGCKSQAFYLSYWKHLNFDDVSRGKVHLLGTMNVWHFSLDQSGELTSHLPNAPKAPVSAPTNISCYNATLNSLVLQWSSIPEEDIRGFLLGYVIYYSEYHHRGIERSKHYALN